MYPEEIIQREMQFYQVDRATAIENLKRKLPGYPGGKPNFQPDVDPSTAPPAAEPPKFLEQATEYLSKFFAQEGREPPATGTELPALPAGSNAPKTNRSGQPQVPRKYFYERVPQEGAARPVPPIPQPARGTVLPGFIPGGDYDPLYYDYEPAGGVPPAPVVEEPAPPSGASSGGFFDGGAGGAIPPGVMQPPAPGTQEPMMGGAGPMDDFLKALAAIEVATPPPIQPPNAPAPPPIRPVDSRLFELLSAGSGGLKGAPRFPGVAALLKML